MQPDDALSLLRSHEGELRKLGVERLYLFGSMARGESRTGSDVDLFFDHAKGCLGIFDLMDVRERAADILGREVDIMTRDSLHPVLRHRIEEAAIQVF